LRSYLKIDTFFEVPIQMLDEAADPWGYMLMIWPTRRGGVAELRDHVRRRDQARAAAALTDKFENLLLSSDDAV
jgi:hypothetical protein